ncbi:hypothetical protein [Oleomonas cavernae]|uniref:hypothetical protein n=1 Tax=Oleomonas cavernae TaxID=2320859 RepID=UPI00131461BC|nr:hypothetical protein [Oleomonas cavernae]
MMLLNPELRRNLWLELSTQRLIAMPAVLFLLFMMGWTWDQQAAVAQTAMVVCWAILVFWGSRMACDSVVSEVQGRTWDGQRLSGIGPSAMTLGKLLGGTVYSWYGAAICLGAVLASGGVPGDDLAPVRLVVTGLFAHSIALWFGLIQLRLQSGVRRFQVTFAQIVAILASFQFLPLVVGFEFEINWYGIVFQPKLFALLVTALFALWGWIGCYRLMRAELQYRSRPLVWLLFLVFLVVFFNGFTNRLPEITDSLAFGDAFVEAGLSFHVLVMATWAAGFLEPKSIVRLRRLLGRLTAGDWQGAFADMPPWVAGLPVIIAVGVATVAQMPEGGRVAAQLVATFLFLLRDMALVYYVVLGPRMRRGHLAALVYLIVLYVVVPAILAGAGGVRLLPLFAPMAGADLFLGLIGPAAQLIGIGFLLSTRFTRPSVQP